MTLSLYHIGLSLVLLVVLATVVCLALYTGRCAEFGRFSGPPEARFLDDGRKMELLADFTYIDGCQEEWIAPKGAIVDGASIPVAAWSIIGGPFAGKFRNAAVVHDAACDSKARTWEATHEMFYEACLAGGVSEPKAKLMFGMVYVFGPHWLPDGSSPIAVRDPAAEERGVAKLREWIESENPSLEEIKRFTP